MFALPSHRGATDATRAGALVTVDLLIASDPTKGPR